MSADAIDAAIRDYHTARKRLLDVVLEACRERPAPRVVVGVAAGHPDRRQRLVEPEHRGPLVAVAEQAVELCLVGCRY